MEFVGNRQTYDAVNYRTGIPAAIGLIGIVDSYRENVFRVEFHIRRQLVLKANVSVWSAALGPAVNPHLAVLIHTVEGNKYFLAFFVRREPKMFPVPTDSTGKITEFGLAGISPVFRAFDTPVMRDLSVFPAGVIKLHLLRTGRVALYKSPVEAQIMRSEMVLVSSGYHEFQWQNYANRSHQ